jgi:antitoxin HicB
MIQYQIKMYKEGNGYWGEFPDLPGCLTQGETLEEFLEYAREALSLYLEEARDPNWEIPVPKNRKGKSFAWVTPYEDVAIPLMIRQARLEKGIGQRQLAKRLGMSVQQIQRLETPGKSNPTIKTLSAISRALDERLEIKLIA